MSALGDALKAAREAKGWTLRQAARETGVANAHLSQVETGRITQPSASLVLALCGPYGLDPAALLRMAGHDAIADVIGNGAERVRMRSDRRVIVARKIAEQEAHRSGSDLPRAHDRLVSAVNMLLDLIGGAS